MAFLWISLGAIFGIVIYEAIAKRRKGYFELKADVERYRKAADYSHWEMRRDDDGRNARIKQLESELKIAAAELIVLRRQPKEEK